MSGGHFGSAPYEIQRIREEIEQQIEKNDDKTPDRWGDIVGREYPPAVIAEFANAVKSLKVAQVYAQRVDYLLSGDDGEDSFLRRLAAELGALGALGTPDAALAERERCALVADAEHDGCMQNARGHGVLGNNDYARQWEKRARSCAAVASEIRKGAP